MAGLAKVESGPSAAEGFSTGGDLVLSDVTKRFGDYTAVDGVSLEIGSGSFFALLGPSGCGKTTTLRMVAGLEHPSGGRISIGGRDVTTEKPHRRPVNTVFQSYALFPHLDVVENVAFGLRRRRVPDATARALEALDLVQLRHLAARRPGQLSGGQQQRVALARAVVNRPDVLLLDEPLGALDLKLRRQMQTELKRIQTEVGLTFVHVTHDQEEAMTMADTVAVMNAGRVEQLGAPDELYDLPRTAFVANFLGQSNLLRGEVVGSGRLLGVRVGQTQVHLPEHRAAVTAGPVLVGVRPEKMHMVTADRPAAADLDVLGPGVVVDVSFTGVSTSYVVDVPGHSPLTVFSQNLGAGAGVRPGDRVSVGWSPRHAFGLSGEQDATAGVTALDDEE